MDHSRTADFIVSCALGIWVRIDRDPFDGGIVEAWRRCPLHGDDRAHGCGHCDNLEEIACLEFLTNYMRDKAHAQRARKLEEDSMGHHLTKDGKFKSDKYAWCPEGFFALKLTDPTAQAAALLYSSMTTEKELCEDLRTAIVNIQKSA